MIMFHSIRLSIKNININYLSTIKGIQRFCTTNAPSNGQQESKEINEDSILVEKDDNITLIGINRPKQRNSINKETAEKLTTALVNFEDDDTSPIAVLYGEGGNFCAGYDIQELENQVAKSSMDFLLRHEGSVGPTRRHMRKPVICSITGYCIANGLELALMCDMRIMEETAVLGFFNRRFGVPLSDGGTVRLGAIIGLGRALDFLHTGRPISAKEALQLGLINRVVATGTALGQAVNLAFSIAKFSQAPLQQDRNTLYVNTYRRHGFRTSVQNEIMNTSKEVIHEIKEGVKRFKQSKQKGAKTDAWHIKEKVLTDWEKAEMIHESKAQK